MRSNLVPKRVQMIETGIQEVALAARNLAIEVDRAFNMALGLTCAQKHPSSKFSRGRRCKKVFDEVRQIVRLFNHHPAKT